MTSRPNGLRAELCEAIVHIRVIPARRLPTGLVEAAHTQIAYALTRFQRAIRSVTVAFDDASNPQHGKASRCTVTVQLSGSDADVVASHTEAVALAALARATARAARAVTRRLDWRRSWRLAGGAPKTSGRDARQIP